MKIRRVVPVVVATLLAVASASAHETPKSSDIAVTLKPISRDLVGVRVQIVNSVAYQLVVENQSRKELEILDAKDRPFLRIGPGGALGEIASRGGETKWKSLNSQPSWGWIDPRLSTDVIKVTEAVRERDRESRVGSWKIPVRFDGERYEIAGDFIYQPPQHGFFRARITSPAEVAPRVYVGVSGGQIPGIFLQNDSGAAITVIGAEGEPFLRIGPDSVFANADSATWKESGRAPEENSGEAARANPRLEKQRETREDSNSGDWKRVSGGSRYSWLEKRAAYLNREPPRKAMKGHQPAELKTWKVPLVIDGRKSDVTGVTEWVPYAGDHRHHLDAHD